MDKWRTEIRLRFRLMPFKVRVGFCFEWKAWFIAWDLFSMGPDEFGKLEIEQQITALAYGAAYWDRVKQGKKVFFSYEDIVFALNKASKEENLRIPAAIKNSQFPDWMKKNIPETDKKKVKTK